MWTGYKLKQVGHNRVSVNKQLNIIESFSLWDMQRSTVKDILNDMIDHDYWSSRSKKVFIAITKVLLCKYNCGI